MRGRLNTAFDERRIDDIFGPLDRCHAPGAAVGIALEGRVRYRRGFGLANLELPLALSPAMRMRIGSLTKHFTCLGYLLLCEEGKAHPDDPIGRHLPELPPIARRVTARQLMGHVSGLRDVHDLSWHFSGTAQPVSSDDLFSLYRDIEDLNAQPQTAWIYNNGGFLLLSIAIERIAALPLEDFLAQRIFAPLGLYDTRLRRFDTDFLPNSAALHMSSPDGGFTKAYLGTALAGEGGMMSTVDDMLRWLAHMDQPVVGTADTWSMIKTPQTLKNGTSTGYGLGLRLGQYRGSEILVHAGGVMGGNAYMVKVPAAALDVIVLVNRHDISAMELANRVLDACLPDLEPPTERPTGTLIDGVYRSGASGRVVQLFGNEGRQMASLDGVDMEVTADRDNRLRPAGIFSHLKREIVVKDDSGVPGSIRLVDFGDTDELTRVPPPRAAAAEAMFGRYRSDSTDVEISVYGAASQLELKSTGRFGSAHYSLVPVGERICRARSHSVMPWSGIVCFGAEGETLQFTTGRTYGLSFRRLP